MDKEEWRNIAGFESLYKISSIGRCKSLERKSFNGKYYIAERILKPLFKNGYWYYQLRKGNKTIREYAHRLVAQTFIENKNNLPQINHKDGIKTNNEVKNLEWVTCSQNMQHAHDIGLMLPVKERPRARKSVIQLDYNGNTVKEYNSILEASRLTGTPKSSLCRCVKGQSNHAGNFKWKYK